MLRAVGVPSARSVLLLNAHGYAEDHVRSILGAMGLRVLAPCTHGALRSQFPQEPSVIAILDCEDCEENWQNAAAETRAAFPTTPLILLTSRGSESLAVSALRLGVMDYLPLPLDARAVRETLNRCLSAPRKPRGPREAEPDSHSESMIGSSAAISTIRGYMRRAAATDCTVLITGETGTGKELAAEYIHKTSPRRGKPFVCVHCAAIPELLLESELFGHARGAYTGATDKCDGLIASADGGTVLLDEIGDMSLQAQAKILRVLEKKEVTLLGGTRSRQVNVRFLAATNQDLEAMTRQGGFRKDLYYRLNVARVELPPLRERKEDIPLLVEHFRRRLGQEAIEAVSNDCLERLMEYEWPGNIRELRNVLERIFLVCESGVVESSDLPAEMRGPRKGGCELGASERERLVEALCSSEWNKSRAAEQMHWSRMTLYRKLAKYRIKRFSSPDIHLPNEV